MNRFIYKIGIIFCIIVCTSCEDIFKYSPYELKVKAEDLNQTINNVGLLELSETEKSDSFTFIAITDSHYDYYELEKAISKINSLNNIDFVVHLGDFADHGWLEEYEIYSKYIRDLNIPVFTCIGNHDYLSNGGEIYKQMFGPNNYTIQYKNRLLIFFDATLWESNKPPDMNWFSTHVSENDKPKIIFSHIPAGSDQFSMEDNEIYRQSVQEGNVILSMHGHFHHFETGKLFDTDVDYIVVEALKNRKLYKIKVLEDNSYSLELIPFKL